MMMAGWAGVHEFSVITALLCGRSVLFTHEIEKDRMITRRS
jgi:hypothetical protein